MTEKEKSVYLLSIAKILDAAGIPYIFNKKTNNIIIAEQHETDALLNVYLASRNVDKN